MLHTKGTWITKEGQIYPVETGKTLALIPYFDNDNEEMKANAKLISLAPELLQALKGVLAHMDEPDEFLTPQKYKRFKQAERLIAEVERE